MKAVRIHEFGGENVLRYEDAPMPEPKAGEVLIKVAAVSMNRADLSRRAGSYRAAAAPAPTFPMALGLDGAGVIEAVGEGVTDRSVGERVAFFGPSYAEYTCVPAAATALAPDGLSLEVAACVPIIFMTAWYCLRGDATSLKDGETALIQAGGSGVGTAAIQIAKYTGAKVITTASTDEKCQKSLDLGADIAINYSTHDFVEEVKKATDGHGVNVVLESVGGEVYTKSLEAMAPGGRLVSIGRSAAPVPEVEQKFLEEQKITATPYNVGAQRNTDPEGMIRDTEMILMFIDMGVFKVVIDRTFPLSEAAAAHRHLGERKAFGKVVLVP